MTLNQKRIVRVLNSLKLDGWTLLVQEEERSALYLTKGEQVETSIDSTRVAADVTVCKRYGAEVGDARFTLFSDDEQELRAKVREALVICAAAKKPWYPLAKRQAYSRVELADQKILRAFRSGQAATMGLGLWSRIRSAARKERGVALNAAELHLSRTRSSVANSEGVVGASERTELFVDAVLTSFRRREEQEFHATKRVNRLADFDPGSFVAEAARLARDILAAERFGRVQERNLLLSGDALREFWSPNLDLNPVVFHASGQAKHRGLSRYEQGMRITANRRLSLSSDPLVSFNPGSSRFDTDGVASKEVAIIKEGIIQNLFASQRYAHYLKIPATGGLGVIELAPGKESSAALRSDGGVEIVSFSSFSPNSISGDFSAEIRLAYVLKDGKRIPVRAAMLSGNLFQMLDAMRLSEERAVGERYSGPALVRFDAGCRLAGF
jgi:predicted Zn-dependent protease